MQINGQSPFRMAESKFIQLSNFSNNPQNMKSPALTSSMHQVSQQSSTDKHNESIAKYSDSYQNLYDTIHPIQIQCQNCHTFSSSIVTVEATSQTYIAALILSLICVCWLPFVLKQNFMKIRHSCPGCDKVVGEYDYLNEKLSGNGN